MTEKNKVNNDYRTAAETKIKKEELKKKRNKRKLNIMNFIFSAFILGTAIGKKFDLSSIEWIAIMLWFGGIALYNFSSSKNISEK